MYASVSSYFSACLTSNLLKFSKQQYIGTNRGRPVIQLPIDIVHFQDKQDNPFYSSIPSVRLTVKTQYNSVVEQSSYRIEYLFIVNVTL